MDKIPVGEVRFHDFSYRDPNGRLFEWRGDLYRGLTGNFTDRYKRLLSQGAIQKLIDEKLLIDTQTAPLELDGYAMIVKHHRVPFISYGFEWSAGMLKAAALATLDINIELARHGTTIPDIHPANILFDGPMPVYIDLTAIEDAPEQSDIWPPHAEQMFRQFFLYPLCMMAGSHHRIAHWLLHDFDNGVLSAEFEAVCGGAPSQSPLGQMRSGIRLRLSRVQGPMRTALKLAVAPLRKKAGGAPGKGKPGIARLEEMRRAVEAVDVSFPRTEWTDYYENDFPAFEPSSEWSFKRNTVHDILKRLRPSTVLDIGSNRGWYSQLAATLGMRVVALELVESSVDLLYHDAKARNYPILPLLMSIKSPSGGYGLRNRWFPPASKRLACDLVLCLALTHHLALREEITFEQIAEALREFCNRWLLVEFVPREDRWCRKMWSPRFPDYSVENFMAALKKQFRSVELLGAGSDTRQLIMCEL